MNKHYLPALLAGFAAVTAGQLHFARGQFIQQRAVFLPAPAQIANEVDEPQQEGPDVIMNDEGGPPQEGQPIQPQVQQILGSIGTSVKKRDAAEQKLVDLGPDAVTVLKSQIGSVKGAARDALVVAIFRIENAPLSPKDAIETWVAKKTESDPAAVIMQHIAADDLRKLFPNHLFYTAENKPDASGKGGFPRTVIALAADGKIQPINDDTTLAKFLKYELPEKSGKIEQRRGAAAAAVLALARDVAIPVDLAADGQITGDAITGSAQITGPKARKVSVALKFTPDGRVASLTTTAETPTPPDPKAGMTGAPGVNPPEEGASTLPAGVSPATTVRKHPPVRLRAPEPDSAPAD